MKKIFIVFLCVCSLYTSFWFFRAYHLKKMISSQIRTLEYSEMHCGGFPFRIDVHLKDPKWKSLFQLEGNLTLGTSLFARKGWVKASGNGKAAFLGKKLEFSGAFGCKHHNLWQLIRNKSLLSQPIQKNLSKLLPKLTLFSDSISLKYQGQTLSADRIFAQNQFDRESGLLRFNIKGAQSSLEALQKYYFKEKCDLRCSLAFKDYTESDSKIGRCQGGALLLSQATTPKTMRLWGPREPAPKQTNLEGWSMQADLKSSGCPTQAESNFKSRAVYLEIQDLCIEDPYFRHQFSGVIKNLSKSEGDLTFRLTQAVKKEYHPDLQKRHLSRIVGGIGSAIPERRLFGLICGSGDLHFSYELKTWAIELRKCSWKFGRYEMDLTGKINKQKALLDVDFHYYPELKLFIAKKLTSVSELLALIESQGSLDEQTNTLKLQLQFEDSTGWSIGELPISL